MNDFLTYLNEKLGREEPLTPHSISWNLAPKINAVCRSNNMEAKEILFKAFAGEYDMEEAVKLAQKCHREQTTIVKRIYEGFLETIDNTHKIIICFGENKDRNYLGLVANKLMSHFNKPTIVLRELNKTTWSGSVRSPITLLEKINETSLARCQGHPEAFGITVKKDKLNELINWFDNQDLEVEPCVPITAILTPQKATVKLAKLCTSYSHLWGHGLDAPMFYITGSFHGSNVNVYRKKTNTIKFNINGMDFLMFRATDEEADLFNSNKLMDIEMVVSLSINEWRGEISVQGIIEEYEIHKHKSEIQSQEDWKKLF